MKISTKKALIASVLSLVLCVSMLVGSTFAWFTDTATTSVNKIVAGNLDIELQMATEWNDDGSVKTWANAEGKTLPFLVKGEIPAEGTKIYWEPGCTYYVPEVRVLNKGNLAVKFEYLPEMLGSTDQLFEVLELVFNVPTDAEGNEVNIEPEVLQPGEASPAWSFGYHMKETAGNEYQGLTATGMSVTVVASQATYEKDSKDDQYDKDATYPVYSIANAVDLVKAFEKGGILNVTEDLNLTEVVVSTAKTTLNMGGKTVANTNDLWNEATYSWSLVSARVGELTIEGNGKFAAKENDCFAVDVQDGAKVVIKDGTFIGNISAVYVYEGELVVEGGFFEIQQHTNTGTDPYAFMLNCYDANRAAGTAKITVKGGTYVNFNPADCAAEGAHTNFVAAGYHVVSTTQANGDVWYTVVAD